MGVKVAAGGCFQWSSSQTIIPQSHPPYTQTIPSSKRRSRSDVALACLRHAEKSALFGTSTKLGRTRSYDPPPPSNPRASFDHAFSEEHFSNQNNTNNNNNTEHESPPLDFPFPEEPPWKEDIVTERKANSLGLPLSLRVIKKKIQWEEGFREATESAYCSIKKAFSSMVFIIQELHNYSLQLREVLFTEDLQEIIVHVHKEIHASFVWLFKQVFSHTPTLMVYVMILLANFTVYSMGSNVNVALASDLPRVAACENQIEIVTKDEKSFSVSSTTGKLTSIGGGGGGGGNLRPLSSGTEDDGYSNRSRFSQFESVLREEENLWDSIVEEASSLRGESVLDQETVERLVSPVDAKIEPEDYSEYLGTELLYQLELSEDPNNPLLLANYAQFLYIVARDYDRAEKYFKKAIGVEPKDAEAYNKYASFLWRARNDLWAAEETFLEAINVEPNNSSYAANYAHFLWNTGGEDTCFPIHSPDANQEA